MSSYTGNVNGLAHAQAGTNHWLSLFSGRSLWHVGVLLLCCLTMVGCKGGSDDSGGGSSTPPATTTYTLTYTAAANGTLIGTSPQTQTVNNGSDGSAVTAFASAGYAFDQWSDGNTDNPRTDTNVTADLNVVASFKVNLAAPPNVSATSGFEQVKVQWDAVPGAASYSLCYATESNIDFANCASFAGGTLVLNVTSPHSVTGLTNGTQYFFRVVAVTPSSGDPGPASLEASATPHGFNDTGITKCSDYASGGGSGMHQNNLDCAAVSATQTTDGTDADGDPVPAGQDAVYGLDVTANNLKDGAAGFSFTKLDVAGNPLSVFATSWSCVKDNITGLIWEVKTDDGGLRDKDNTYSWYNSTDINDGGNAGAENGGTCSSAGNCDTEKFVAEVNGLATPLCGASDWRLPTRADLQSIVHYGADPAVAAIDPSFFPNTPSLDYWSSSPYASSAGRAWFVDFDNGIVLAVNKFNDNGVRLVRAGQ